MEKKIKKLNAKYLFNLKCSLLDQRQGRQFFGNRESGGAQQKLGMEGKRGMSMRSGKLFERATGIGLQGDVVNKVE